jgi:D-alanyl-D-alanine carboxypeptidase
MDTARLGNTVVTVCYCTVACIAALSSAMSAFAERASLVIDADSGAVLYAKNARLQSFPASLTKLMTVITDLKQESATAACRQLRKRDQ